MLRFTFTSAYVMYTPFTRSSKIARNSSTMMMMMKDE